MADPVEMRMSVTSIKRVDPYVKEILAKSTHVALYKFNPSINEWEKTDTEGALFLYSRNGEPYHSIMVMNRLNTENLIEPIVKEFEYQMQAPFLLYRNSKSKIFGIWFYNRDECVSLTLILETVMETVKEKNIDKNKKADGVDIFGLLSRAQEDYNKTPIKQESHPQFSTPRAPDVTSQSVMDFFAKAGTKSAAKPVHTPESEIQFTLQKLMNNPAHSVEHIEKQQRSITPQKNHKENGMNFIRVSSPKPTSSSPLATFLGQKVKEDRDPVTSPMANLMDSGPAAKPPALMAPIMFASCASKPDEPECSSSLQPVEPLTKNQMLQAVTYLLKNDSDFVTKIHEAYVRSMTEKVNCSSSLNLN